MAAEQAPDNNGFLDGKKTYLSAGAMMASGLALQLKALSDGHGISPEAVQLFMTGLGFLFTQRAIAKL